MYVSVSKGWGVYVHNTDHACNYKKDLSSSHIHNTRESEHYHVEVCNTAHTHSV